MSLFGLLFRLAFFLIVAGVATAGAGAVMRFAFPEAWKRWLRRAFRWSFVATAVLLSVWTVGRGVHSDVLMRTAAPLAAVLLMGVLFLFLTSPFWGAVGGAARLPADPARRRFLGRAAAVFPSAAVLAGPGGAVAAAAAPKLRRFDVTSRLVPQALDGFTVLQLSDIHLGTFIDVDQVRAVVAAVQSAGVVPDIVALTGDIADDYNLLGPALDAVLAVKPKHGTFAIVGNHEIYRGRERAREIVESKGVRWLCDEGLVIDGKLWLGGTDDPARSRMVPHEFYQNSVAACLKECPADIGCKVVLAHRPEAFDVTQAHGVALTLSGHTHGGQMAMFGRSLLEGLAPLKYMLGLYRGGGANESVLFTTAGLGHWFPFRLNCPTEAALVTLRAA